jgi:hypothetical protein
VEKIMREFRVLRGKGPLIYPGNLRAGYVRVRGQICPVQNDVVVSEKLRNH